MIIPKIYQPYISTAVVIKDEWLYHGFSPYYLERYLKKGIVSKIFGVSSPFVYNRGSYQGYNGMFHVSLAKKDQSAVDSRIQ